MNIHQVSRDIFCAALSCAQTTSTRVAKATSKADEMPSMGRFYLSEDALSGFGITPDGEFVGLFSLKNGRGDRLVTIAMECGANRLDCFDGFLPEFYSRHGWVEVDRVSNWTPGEPDVVFMALR